MCFDARECARRLKWTPGTLQTRYHPKRAELDFRDSDDFAYMDCLQGFPAVQACLVSMLVYVVSVMYTPRC